MSNDQQRIAKLQTQLQAANETIEDLEEILHSASEAAERRVVALQQETHRKTKSMADQLAAIEVALRFVAMATNHGIRAVEDARECLVQSDTSTTTTAVAAEVGGRYGDNVTEDVAVQRKLDFDEELPTTGSFATAASPTNQLGQQPQQHEDKDLFAFEEEDDDQASPSTKAARVFERMLRKYEQLPPSIKRSHRKVAQIAMKGKESVAIARAMRAAVAVNQQEEEVGQEEKEQQAEEVQ